MFDRVEPDGKRPALLIAGCGQSSRMMWRPGLPSHFLDKNGGNLGFGQRDVRLLRLGRFLPAQEFT